MKMMLQLQLLCRWTFCRRVASVVKVRECWGEIYIFWPAKIHQTSVDHHITISTSIILNTVLKCWGARQFSWIFISMFMNTCIRKVPIDFKKWKSQTSTLMLLLVRFDKPNTKTKANHVCLYFSRTRQTTKKYIIFKIILSSCNLLLKVDCNLLRPIENNTGKLKSIYRCIRVFFLKTSVHQYEIDNCQERFFSSYKEYICFYFFSKTTCY